MAGCTDSPRQIKAMNWVHPASPLRRWAQEHNWKQDYKIGPRFIQELGPETKLERGTPPAWL